MPGKDITPSNGRIQQYSPRPEDITRADPGINHEGQVGGAQEYEYNYERKGGCTSI